MGTTEPRPPVQAGEPAPDFTLPAIHRDGTVSLSEYRGRSPVLLALFRGLYCPFCRRAIAQLGRTRDKLQPVGVETLAVVATKLENARLYFKYRPTRIALAADPELLSHRAFGVPKPAMTPELMEGIRTIRVNPTGDLPEPLPIADAANTLDAMERFEFTQTDNEEMEQQFPLLVGQFLVGADGIVRWARIECAEEGLAGLGKFPTDEELLAAARTLRA